MSSVKVLVVDDEQSVLISISMIIRQKGYEVVTAETGAEAIELAESSYFNLLITDLFLPDTDGIELLKKITQIHPTIKSIVLTGNGSIETSVQAMKAGAEDYLLKPFRNDEVLLTVERILEKQVLQKENIALKRSLKKKYKFDNIVGNSEVMQKLYRVIEKVADTNSTVLILGASGTGKELVAKTLHYNSSRATHAFVPVHCGAIPENLLESELFGHEKGAFTGAIACRLGRFELANSGTIFLDEIGDMSPQLQVKLLRVLQEREFERVGGTKTIKVDIRIIAATNKNLEKAVEERSFREDLYYRLNVIPINVPPLKDREGDILLLINYFLDYFNKTKEKNITGISPAALSILKSHSWPGNVRELENVVERLVIMVGEGEIGTDDFSDNLAKGIRKVSVNNFHLPEDGIDFMTVVNDFENNLILQAMHRASGVKNKAAKLLRLNRTTLVEKIKKKKLDDISFHSQSLH